MMPSQFTLDHRLAELRQTGLELRQAQAAAQDGGRSPRTIGAAVRTLLGITPARGRPAGRATA